MEVIFSVFALFIRICKGIMKIVPHHHINLTLSEKIMPPESTELQYKITVKWFNSNDYSKNINNYILWM